MGNATVNDLENDAEKALEVLIQQPEVDSNSVTLVGHSEGTMYVTRVAINNPDIVDNIVLMGPLVLGVINLNLNLLKTPEEVIDYIILHELCHLKIRSHSHHYWDM